MKRAIVLSLALSVAPVAANENDHSVSDCIALAEAIHALASAIRAQTLQQERARGAFDTCTKGCRLTQTLMASSDDLTTCLKHCRLESMVAPQ